MTLAAFLLEGTLISLSGVMAPGPIAAVALGKGSRSPYAGSLITVGHGIVELPLMAALFYGVGQLLRSPTISAGVGLVGGALLVMMAVEMFRGVKGVQIESQNDDRSPILIGALLSVGNPYFLIWWATVGASLLLRSIEFGAIGFLAFASLHLLCDLLWNTFLSTMAFQGGRFFGRRFQQVVFAICGAFLLFSGGRLVLQAVTMFLG